MNNSVEENFCKIHQVNDFIFFFGTPRRISAEFLPEVLSLLCALPHQQFYSAVAVLENNAERKPNDDDR